MSAYPRELQWLLSVSAVGVASVLALLLLRSSISSWLAFCLLATSVVFSGTALVGLGYQLGWRGAWESVYEFFRLLLRH